MTAFKATYSDVKFVKTRKVAQIILELPLEQFDAAYEVLGGLPNPASEKWVAVAVLKMKTPAEGPSSDGEHQPVVDKPQAGAKRDWRDMKPAQQAALRGNNPTFRAFLYEQHGYNVNDEDEAADAIRAICRVLSRTELNTNHKACVLWHQLDSEFQAWERVGA